MFRGQKEGKNKNKGFSLVELIIVVAIMAILLGVLAPQYIKYVEKSRVAADNDTADALLGVAHILVTDERYIDYINDGDEIQFSTGGVTTTASIQNALDEYFSDWNSVATKAKSHNGSTYVIHFGDPGNGIFAIQEGWQ